MNHYDTFIFHSYAWNPTKGTIELRYSLDDDVTFLETLTFPEGTQIPAGREDEFDRALFALHMIGGISYYKTCLPKVIEVRSGSLSKRQAAFWKSVYENGLGEFFYKNKIDFTDLIHFPDEEMENGSLDRLGRKMENSNSHLRTLVPVGGGKDSVVTIEELRKKGAQMTLLRLGHHPLIEKFARTAGLPLINVNRSLSPELFKLNEDGALNGHVPITAYLSCVAIATSILNNMDAVAMSNERSANEGNVEFHGKEINHQWSKSEEFEKLFQNYIHDFVTGTVQYGSQLRDKTELQIVGEFVKYPQYFHCTTSCNTNWRIVKEKPKELWCGKCPKCAFVFALFAAYLPKATVLEIFGKNFFEDATLSSLYKELLGLEGFKPFECVGTPEETTEAFTMAHKKGEWDDGIIMQQFLTSDAHH